MKLKSSNNKRNNFFCSWSGGKDSCLAMYRHIKSGDTFSYLLTMLTEKGEFTRSHGLPLSAMVAQSNALGIPLITASTSWENYENIFKEEMRSLFVKGISKGVFGDIDLLPHRKWVERVCGEIGTCSHLPLWKTDRKQLMREFIDAEFKAVIVAVKKEKLSIDFLGRVIDNALIQDLEAEGVDVCGEEGEYHTFVFDGPIFQQKIDYIIKETHSYKGYGFAKITVQNTVALKPLKKGMV